MGAQNNPDGGKSQYKGPETGERLPCLRNSREARSSELSVWKTKLEK